MKKTVAFLLSTAALTAGIQISSAETKHLTARSVDSRHYAQPFILKSKYITLYDQTGNDAGVGTLSQNFESSFDVYDSQAADDFTVPSGQTWTVYEVDAIGKYTAFPDSFRHADSENIFFYQDHGGLPGDVIRAFPGLKGTGNGAGSFAITLPGKGLILKTGHYWVSIQINMNAGYGDWFWENQTTTEGDPAAWQNPGDGFGTGCTTWEAETKCFGTRPGTPVGATTGGQEFVMKGKTRGG